MIALAASISCGDRCPDLWPPQSGACVCRLEDHLNAFYLIEGWGAVDDVELSKEHGVADNGVVSILDQNACLRRRAEQQEHQCCSLSLFSFG